MVISQRITAFMKYPGLAEGLACGFLIDERLGRKIARLHDIPVVGVMGLLLQAKNKGKILSVRPLGTCME